MVRTSRTETDWVEEFRRTFREPTKDEIRKFRASLEEADRLRAHLKIAPLTTGELVRSIRDERESANS